jgi:hypothetical protein
MVITAVSHRSAPLILGLTACKGRLQIQGFTVEGQPLNGNEHKNYQWRCLSPKQCPDSTSTPNCPNNFSSSNWPPKHLRSFGFSIQTTKMAKKTTLKEFEAVFPKLEEVLLDHARKYNLPAGELAWYKKVRPNPHLQAPRCKPNPNFCLFCYL